MSLDAKDDGKDELFEATHGHRMLVLNGNRWLSRAALIL